jgi:predicted branched-subunit amino acid permease
MTPKPTSRFTLAGFWSGVVGAGTLIPTIAIYGLAVGIMSGTVGLSTAEATLFSAWVYAGGAQLAALQAWTQPLSLVALCLTTLAMQTRYVLMSASLRPWLSGAPAYQTYPSLFMLGDGNWVMAIREHAQGRRDIAFLFGSGFVLWVVWIVVTALGHMGGQIIDRPERFGADFLLSAFFTTMAVAVFRKASSLGPLLGGIITAVIVERLIAGPWYIVAGALVGSLIGAARHVDPR